MATQGFGNGWEQAVADVGRNWQSQARPGSIDRRVWGNPGPERIVALLADAAAPARPAARALVQQMQAHPWRIVAAGHEGGDGDARGMAGGTPQIVLQVNGREVRLRCREAPSLHVVEITA